MPDTTAEVIPGVRLEYDHGVYIGGSFVLHHPLIAGRTIAGRSVGWPESVHRPCAMVTQRGDGRRRAAHTPAVRRGREAVHVLRHESYGCG
jgi:hypothetical protein